MPEANQGVGVDERHFYAVDNHAIAQVRQEDRQAREEVAGADKKGPIMHLDSAMLMDGKIYAAHSNYPEWPMTSSLEIFDAETMEHIGTHSFGIQWGSLTWADWHDGHWWMTFANYDRRSDPDKTPYGHKANTLMVKFTEGLPPGAVVDAAQGDPRPLRGHEQLRRLVGSGRLPLPLRPRPGGDLQDAAAEGGLGAGARGHHPDEHPRARASPGTVAAGRDLRDHPRDGDGARGGEGHKVTVFRMIEK